MMKTRTGFCIIVIGLLVSLFSCSESDNKQRSYKSKEVTKSLNSSISLDSNQYVILDYRTFYSNLFPESVTAASLNTMEIIECEKLLRTYIENYNLKKARLVDSLKANKSDRKYELEQFQIDLPIYKRQYIAVQHNKEKLVFINALCHVFREPVTNDSTGWKRQFVSVNDGGKCYFQVLLNLNKKKVIRFSVNGEA